MSVQNKKASVEPDVRVIVDEVIVNTVYDIFKRVMELNPVHDLFDDLTDQLAKGLIAQSFMEYNLELTNDQRSALGRCVSAKGHAAVRTYLSNVEKDERTRRVYDIVKEKTGSIADAVLSSVGREINRGAVINAVAVQANAKSEDYDEILLRKTKTSGDITIPTHCVLISTNCVSVIKSSCDRQTNEEKRNETGAGVPAAVAAARDEKTFHDGETGKTLEISNIPDEAAGDGGDLKTIESWEDIDAEVPF
jgi:hypothetical protein